MYSIRDAEGRFVGSARSVVAAHRALRRRAAVGGGVERNRSLGLDVFTMRTRGGDAYRVSEIKPGSFQLYGWTTDRWHLLGHPKSLERVANTLGGMLPFEAWDDKSQEYLRRWRPSEFARAGLNRAGGEPDLSTIRVLYRDWNLQLFGIPYDMRPGQQPRDLERARDAREEPRPGHHGPKRIVLDWIWLGSPGWWGSMSKERRAEVEKFLAHFRDAIPGNYPEWSELPRETNWPHVDALARRTT